MVHLCRDDKAPSTSTSLRMSFLYTFTIAQQRGLQIKTHRCIMGVSPDNGAIGQHTISSVYKLLPREKQWKLSCCLYPQKCIELTQKNTTPTRNRGVVLIMWRPDADLFNMDLILFENQAINQHSSYQLQDSSVFITYS